MFIKIPQEEHDQQLLIQKFFEINNFPNVSLCIDCTHIPVKNPGDGRGEIFRNRKGVFSLNIQVRLLCSSLPINTITKVAFRLHVVHPWKLWILWPGTLDQLMTA